MSLIRQVWLVLLGVVLLAFAGSLGVAVVTARDTAASQLRVRNDDQAAALAFALSRQPGDAAGVQAVLAGQFGTGLYHRLRFVAADGRVAFSREAALAATRAPAWFVALLPVDAPSGVAPVSAGARALGHVEVAVRTADAHDVLWDGALHAAAKLAAVGLAAALLAGAGIARIGRALDAAVRQAQSLIDGEFVTAAEPRPAELQRLTRAMNAMVARQKQAFEAQAGQVEALRREANADALTGLANRPHFMRQLAALLHGEQGTELGGLVLLRVRDLAGLNRTLGRAAADRMIEALAQALQSYTERVPGCRLGRLNGADFALALPVGGLALETAQAVAKALSVVLPAFGHGVTVAVGAVEMRRDTALAQVMGAADAALAHAESLGPFAVAAGDQTAGELASRGEGAWRQSIARAVAERRLRLAGFPVLDARDRLLHLACPLRLQIESGGAYEPAARWLPLALRGRLTPLIDERAAELALAAIAADGRPRRVHLSAASLADGAFAARLHARLVAAPQAARGLWLAVPEAAAADQFVAVQSLAQQLRPAGVRLGLAHAGERLARIERLFEAGLDHVELDAVAVQGVAGDEPRAHYLQSVVAMLHGLSMTAIAEGVGDDADAQALWRIGVDAVGGPWSDRRRGDLVDAVRDASAGAE